MIKYLLSPFTMFTLLLLAAVVFGLWRKYKVFKILLGVAVGFFLLVSTPFIPVALIKNLENRYPRYLDVSSLQTGKPYHILVLGAGYGHEDGLPPNDRLNPGALIRLSEGIRLYRLLPGSKLIVSGNSMSNRITQAEVLAEAAQVLGIPKEDILLQSEPAITLEEAQTYKKKFASAEYPLIVVTAAAHMPRAMLLFKAQGLNPIPAPTAHLVKLDPNYSPKLRVSLGSLKMAETAFTEFAGIAYTKWFLLN